jgi:hypothetical protein
MVKPAVSDSADTLPSFEGSDSCFFTFRINGKIGVLLKECLNLSDGGYGVGGIDTSLQVVRELR